MIQTRVILILLTKNQGLYKGIKFKNHTYIGDPINAVKIFNEKEVDELAILDIEASKSFKEPNFEHIKNFVSEAFMPVAYGGGVRSIEVAKKLFSIGIEKIIINSAGYYKPELISEITKIFGSQSVIVSVDVKKKFGKYALYSHSGERKEKRILIDYIKMMEEAGAGELIISNIDHDGKMIGYDLNLISIVSDKVDIPVIASCGAGNLSDFKSAIIAGANAVAAGSMFVFQGKYKAVLINYPSQKELKKLFNKPQRCINFSFFTS